MWIWATNTPASPAERESFAAVRAAYLVDPANAPLASRVLAPDISVFPETDSDPPGSDAMC